MCPSVKPSGYRGFAALSSGKSPLPIEEVTTAAETGVGGMAFAAMQISNAICMRHKFPHLFLMTPPDLRQIRMQKSARERLVATGILATAALFLGAARARHLVARRIALPRAPSRAALGPGLADL